MYSLNLRWRDRRSTDAFKSSSKMTAFKKTHRLSAQWLRLAEKAA